MGERLNGIQEVVGSIPIGSTIRIAVPQNGQTPPFEAAFLFLVIWMRTRRYSAGGSLASEGSAEQLAMLTSRST